MPNPKSPQKAQGLFDEIIDNVNQGTQLKALAKEAYSQVFILEAGKPESHQMAGISNGNIQVTVPVKISIDEKAYVAFYRDQLKRFEKNHGLSLKPKRVLMKLAEKSDARSCVKADIFGNFVATIQDDISQHILCVVEKIDKAKKEATLAIYLINGTMLDELRKCALRIPNHIRVEILDEKNKIISWNNIDIADNINSQNIYIDVDTISLFIISNSLKQRNNESTALALIGPGCFKITGSHRKYHGFNSSDINLRVPSDYPVITQKRALDAKFNLPAETLKKARAFRCVMNFEKPEKTQNL